MMRVWALSLVMAAALVASFQTVSAMPAADPLDPTGSVDPVAASPLRQITIAIADPALTRRFFVDAMGMVELPQQALSRTGSVGVLLKGATESLTFSRANLPDAALIRAIVVTPDRSVLRANHDALAIGGLAMGMPVHGQAQREAVVTAAGFRSAVGITQMTLPQVGGPSYTVEEIHYRAPDGILVLGIDRGAMNPVGPVDPASSIGGPAYSSIVVGDLAGANRFMRQVLRYELRRDAVFTSAGKKGGLGLPDGTRFAFQQWFAPGSSTGYVILMKMVDRPVDPAPAAGPVQRGIAMWSFDIADLAAAEARARAVGARIVARPRPGAMSLIVAMPDGFLVELTQRKRVAR